MDGLYGVYYSGSAGVGAFGLLLYGGNVFGVDVGGGDITGTYTVRDDGGVDFALTFSFAPGTALVTGQAVTQPMVVDSNVRIAAGTLAGGQQPVDLPFGRVMVRVRKKANL
jgi:hypothetical protein